ncbi:MAG: AbrB/MazE/SpoVT family DNA-binding domain-containing protein [Candidatus Bathyarchaeia archaeon]
MAEKSKVMEKWQTVIPSKVREQASIRVGDTLTWRYEAGLILIEPPMKVTKPSETLYGLTPSRPDAVKAVKRIRRTRLEKITR